MDTIHTLSQLLNNSGCQFKIYDLGRRIQPIDNALFTNIEQGMQPYPYPLQRKAHLAIAYWNEENQPWIWFLKFELDERGLLQQADIGNFLKYVMEAMGTRLSKDISQEQQDALANNPYTFKPTDDKMAVFHSQIRAELGLSTSQYYHHALDYFNHQLGWDNWQTVGLQGITDMATRLSEQGKPELDNNGVLIRKALQHLPMTPLYAVLGALEHIVLTEKLSERLWQMLQQQITAQQPDLFLVSALIRALSGASGDIARQAVSALLQSELLSHREVLIGIAGRAWQPLSDAQLAETFLLRLAQTGDQSLFNQLFSDLVMLPSLRMVLLPILHGTASAELTAALHQLQQKTKSTH